MEKVNQKFLENISFLNQLVKTLEEVELNLEKSYERRDYEDFSKSKNFILQIQKKISEKVT